VLDTIIRAVRGATRSPLRSILVVLVLAVGLSFALTAVALAYAAEDELDKVKSTTGVQATVDINPEQFDRAIQEQIDANGGDPARVDIGAIRDSIEPLTQEDVEAIGALPYVRNAQGFANVPVNYSKPGEEETAEENTPEQPQGGPGGRGFVLGELPDAALTGVDDPAFLEAFRSGTNTLVEGRLPTADDAGKSVIVIDQNTANLGGLKVGETVTLKAPKLGDGPVLISAGEEPPEIEYTETTAEIIGIYATTETESSGGIGFSIADWYSPLSVVQDLQAEESAGELSSISIVVTSVDDFARLRTDMAEIIDPEMYALNTTEDSFAQISDPIVTMRNTSLVVMVVGLAVVGAIMVLLMVLVMRSRLREIGILRAIGARSRDVVAQFSLETVGIALLAVVIAVPSVLAINTFLPDLIRPGTTAEAAGDQAGGLFSGPEGPGGGGGPNVSVRFGGPAGDPVRTEEIEAALDRIDASVGVEVIGIGAGVAVLLGLLGSLVTMFTVLRLRPADVLRMEA
jgi:ABC-type antimicrobial peptide transport system permease subunit